MNKSQNLYCIRRLRHFVNKTTQTPLFYFRFFIDLWYLRCYREQCILLSAILHQSKNRSCFNIRWRGVYPISPMMDTEQNRYKKSPQIKITRRCDSILDHLILFTYLLMVFFISRGENVNNWPLRQTSKIACMIAQRVKGDKKSAVLSLVLWHNWHFWINTELRKYAVFWQAAWVLRLYRRVYYMCEFLRKQTKTFEISRVSYITV